MLIQYTELYLKKYLHLFQSFQNMFAIEFFKREINIFSFTINQNKPYNMHLYFTIHREYLYHVV